MKQCVGCEISFNPVCNNQRYHNRNCYQKNERLIIYKKTEKSRLINPKKYSETAKKYRLINHEDSKEKGKIYYYKNIVQFDQGHYIHHNLKWYKYSCRLYYHYHKN